MEAEGQGTLTHRCTTKTIANRPRKAIPAREVAHEDAIDTGRIELSDHGVESRGDSDMVALGAEGDDRCERTVTLDDRQRIPVFIGRHDAKSLATRDERTRIAHEASDTIASVVHRQRRAR